MYGKGLVSEGEIKHHKAMAQGKAPSGELAGRLPGSVQTRPSSTTGELSDAQRCCPGGARGSYGQQAAPNHGDTGRDSYRREGKL